MKRKKSPKLVFIISVVVLFIILVGIFLHIKNITNSSSAKIDAGDIVVLGIRPNQVIKSPLKLSGEARGWFFEGVFGVKVLDGENKEIGQAQAHATSDWMSNKMVSYNVEINFTKPETPTGNIVFTKDNPSGLPPDNRSMWLPVRFHD